MADLIIVLDGSRVVEVGGHDELMARDGMYRDLFSLQARAYADGHRPEENRPVP